MLYRRLLITKSAKALLVEHRRACCYRLLCSWVTGVGESDVTFAAEAATDHMMMPYTGDTAKRCARDPPPDPLS